MTETLTLVASAIAGRAVEVAPAHADERTWTDGQTIFVEPAATGRDRVRLVGVQASLLAGGSLRAEVCDQLRGRRSLAQRYLAVEGHRALAANEASLPAWMTRLIDRGLAAGVATPEESLARAKSDRAVAPPWVFGALDARRITAPVADATFGGDAVPEALPELPADDDDAGGDLGRVPTSPVGDGGAIGKLLARWLRPGRAGERSGSPGADAPTHASPRITGAGRTIVSGRAVADGIDGPHAPARFVYPEWDVHRRAYRPDWCHVVADTATAADVAVDAADNPALRRALARLGTGLTPCRRRPQGEDLDIDALVDARVHAAAGGVQDDDVYVEALRRRRDLSVLVLLDVSGSAGEPGVAGRSVHAHQCDAAAALTGALHRLGDRVALYAFNSRGRTAVHVAALKTFDERAGEVVDRRLGGLRPAAFTRLGAAIRHGAALLEHDGGTPRRLLVVLSDGFAFDHGYEGRYGEADAQRSIREARRRGIGCVCLSVGTRDTDAGALRRVFGAAAHAAVPSSPALASVVGPLFARALEQAR